MGRAMEPGLPPGDGTPGPRPGPSLTDGGALDTCDRPRMFDHIMHAPRAPRRPLTLTARLEAADARLRRLLAALVLSGADTPRMHGLVLAVAHATAAGVEAKRTGDALAERRALAELEAAIEALNDDVEARLA